MNLFFRVLMYLAWLFLGISGLLLVQDALGWDAFYEILFAFLLFAIARICRKVAGKLGEIEEEKKSAKKKENVEGEKILGETFFFTKTFVGVCVSSVKKWLKL